MKLVAAVLMLLTLGALGEVVEDFKKHCGRFFLGEEPPKLTLNEVISDPYKQICQKHCNQYHYATLYDTARRIPVYSAYQYQQKEDCKGKRPETTWMIEPQLEGAEMAVAGTLHHHQAYDSDYKYSGYTRGHLYPFCHTHSDTAGFSTFTLTNIAPQTKKFNNKWSNVETEVTKTLNDCLNREEKVYVVTGVVPSQGDHPETLKEGTVNVPTHFWTAYCCCDKNNKNCKFGGYIMQKDNDEAKKKTKDEFEDVLTTLYNSDCKIQVFSDAHFPQSAQSKPNRKRTIIVPCSTI